MTVYTGRGARSLDIKIAYPGKLGGGLPVAPPGYMFLTDDAGNYLTDDAGNFLIAEAF